jgi:methylglutaconyl-CoA hydratase
MRAEHHALGPVTLEIHDGPLDGLATITLADPDRRNTMGPPMFDGLEASILHLEARTAASRFHPMHEAPPRDSVRVIRVRALGPAFCAGFDLGLLADDPDPAQPLLASFLKRLAGCMRRLRALPAVSVAEVQGPALAGGCGLVVACDLALGCPESRLGYPVHAIGLSPAVSGVMLDARVGSGTTRHMFESGEILPGQQAHALGLLHQIAPDAASLPSLVDGMVASLLAKGPHALAATKRWLQELDRSIDPAQGGAALAASLSGVGSAESSGLLRSVWSARRKS